MSPQYTAPTATPSIADRRKAFSTMSSQALQRMRWTAPFFLAGLLLAVFGGGIVAICFFDGSGAVIFAFGAYLAIKANRELALLNAEELTELKAYVGFPAAE